MEDRFNTIAGWVLAAAIVALGGSLLSSMYFHHEHVEKDGYEVASAEPSGGGEAEKPIDFSVADAAKGKEVFAQCQTCHTINAGGANGTGPNLHAIMGKAKGAVAGFGGYSDGMKAKGGTWTFEDMDAWIKSPRKYVEGTKMGFAGLSDNVKRANLIAYLNSEGSNLPLPAAPAAAAPAAPAEGDAAAANAAAPAVAAANAAAPAANAAAPAAPAK